jgi:hypothetical protein
VSRAVAGAVGTAVVLGLALAPTVEAIHAVDHRYVVLGYVRDATGRPLAGKAVRVVRQKSGLVLEAETDWDGFYVVIVHLHDEDLLGTLWVAVTPRTTLRLKAQFNPFDARTPRGTRVDFTDGVPRERPEEFATALERYVRK